MATSLAEFYRMQNAPKSFLPTTTLPPVPAVAPTASVDPMHALITSLLAPRPQATANQIPWHELIQSTLPGSNDVQGMFNKMSQLPSYAAGSQSPFNTGFFDLNRSSFGLTPEAKLASQGSSAQTQWGALGGLRGVNPVALNALLRRQPAAY